MKYLLFVFTILLFIKCGAQDPGISIVTDNVIGKIAFGSCNKESSKQILWDDVIEDSPDMWIWLGDNIYGDSPDTTVMQAKYQKQKSDEDYQKLRLNTPIYGIWDDHDYGKNDAGKEFDSKVEMRDLMLKFLDVSLSNEVWSREGGYQSYVQTIGDVQVKIILLDSRYFRDKPIRNGNSYDPNLTGTILGQAQWTWLENELAQSNEDLVLIGNGIQVLPEEHRFEKWANFPNERLRLVELIEKSPAPKVILLSGDRHLTEVSKIDNGKIIYEITCSGMTHSYSDFSGEVNKHRIGEVVAQKNYGILKIAEGSEGLKFIFESKGDDGVVHQVIPLDY